MQLHIDLIIPLSPTILPNGDYRKDVLLIFRFPFYGERAAYSATRKRRKNFVFSCRKMSEKAGYSELVFRMGERHIFWRWVSFYGVWDIEFLRTKTRVSATARSNHQSNENHHKASIRTKSKKQSYKLAEAGENTNRQVVIGSFVPAFWRGLRKFCSPTIKRIKASPNQFWIIFQAQFHTILQAILPGSKMITKHPKRAPLMKLPA